MVIAMIIANLLSTLVGTWVGVTLLGIARRTGKTPELLVGLSLFFYAALAQGSMVVSRLTGTDADLGLRMSLIVFRTLAYYGTLVGFAAFAWKVFGADSRWRASLFWAIALVGGIMASFATHAAWLRLSQDVASPVWQRLGTTPPFIVVFAWMSAESLRYYAQMRRRIGLGLADPVVANRFLLWGAGTGLSSPIVFFLLYLTLTRDQLLGGDVLASSVVMLAGFINTTVWWLTFVPPETYLRWVRSRA